MSVKIYGLIDPRDHRVKYVGQTRYPEARFKSHQCAARHLDKPVYEWLRELHPAVPILVVLEEVENRRIWLGVHSVSLASVMEAKWLKRFRCTVLNYDRKQCAAYDEFVNSPELQHKFGLE